MQSEVSLVHDLIDVAADRWPDRVAVAEGPAAWTFAGMRDASAALAEWLLGAGVPRGGRVVVTGTPGPLTAALALAASRAGAVFVLLHEQVRGPALEHILDDCEPAVVVAGDPEALAPARARGIRGVTTADLEPVAARDPVPAPARPLAVDPVCLIYTSGTTALPKAVVSTHQQVVFAARAIQSALGYRDDDIVYAPSPLSFDFGLYQVFLGALSGATIILGGAAAAGPRLLRSVLDSRATILAAVPSVADSLAWLLQRAPARRPGLRLVTTTGAALSGATASALRDAVPGLRVQIMYGLTECKRATIMPPDGDLGRPGSCGLPLPGTEILVIGEAGERLRPGETGEIVVRGPNVMAGYWRRPELTEQRFPRRDGLFPELRTGDYGRLDEDGYLYFDGRRDDQYKERGFRISSVEVEAAARRVDGVQSAAVLLPDGRRPATLVVVADLDPGQVLDKMRGQIEEYKVPRRCVAVDDLPLSQNGKVDRTALAARVSALAL